MQIYVGGRTKNVAEVNLIQEVVMERGHSITHDWTDVEGEGKGEIRDDWKNDPNRARQVAALDFLGVAKADGMILCGYGCEEGGGGLGCFIEAGVALASGVPLVILGPCRESVFWYSPFTLKVYKDEPLRIEKGEPLTSDIEETREDRISLEAAIAVNGLEGLDRQRRLALSDTDVMTKLP